jgi:hypothetical protein
MEYALKLVEVFLFSLGISYVGAWVIVAARGKRPTTHRRQVGG